MKNVIVLGSTGSIGRQTLSVCRNLGYRVTAIAAGSNIELMEQQIRKFNPLLAAVADKSKAAELKVRVADTDTKVLAGEDGICEAAVCKHGDIVLSAIVGIAGLRPTAEAVKCKKDIALANKETLVTAGHIIMPMAKEYGVKILPVDSEHSAVFQSLAGNENNKIKSIILTASGGPFFGYSKEQLRDVTVSQALKHPSWSMGAKITIDSATMMNKGLEIIEAAHLFNIGVDDIQVVIHRESILHSAVEYEDNSVIGQMGAPDMRTAIQYAFTYPKRCASEVKRLNFAELGKMTFYAPDDTVFPAMSLCRAAFKRGGNAPAVLNGANEAAVGLFLNGKIGFTDITEAVKGAIDNINLKNADTIEAVLEADKEARSYVSNLG